MSYANSLQQGDTAPVGTTNANSILPPYRSEQWEAGLKASLQTVDLTLAAFRITRPFAYTNATTSTYDVDGEQRNDGVDFTVNGEILPGLSAFGGISLLDPKLERTATAATNDKRIVGLSRFVGSVLLRWDVPGVPGLNLNGFVRHVSNRPTDNANVFYAPGYTTLDLGAEYVLPVHQDSVAFRLNAYNITDTRYLTNIIPGGLNGYTGAGTASASLGTPRTVLLSVATRF